MDWLFSVLAVWCVHRLLDNRLLDGLFPQRFDIYEIHLRREQARVREREGRGRERRKDRRSNTVSCRA